MNCKPQLSGATANLPGDIKPHGSSIRHVRPLRRVRQPVTEQLRVSSTTQHVVCSESAQRTPRRQELHGAVNVVVAREVRVVLLHLLHYRRYCFLATTRTRFDAGAISVDAAQQQSCASGAHSNSSSPRNSRLEYCGCLHQMLRCFDFLVSIVGVGIHVIVLAVSSNERKSMNRGGSQAWKFADKEAILRDEHMCTGFLFDSSPSTPDRRQ